MRARFHRRVELGTVSVEIWHVEGFLEEQDKHGEYDAEHKRILIDPSDKLYGHTLLHEALHAVIDIYKLIEDNNEEFVVRTLEHAIGAFLGDCLETRIPLQK